MESDTRHDAWSAGQSYDQYMGRWSKKIAAKYLDWLDAPPDADWLEIGCGTGALTSAILAKAAPRSIVATDASADFVAYARSQISDPRATFETAKAQKLGLNSASRDVVTSALVLNFLPDKTAALKEMRRVLRPGGVLSFYVWDYPGGGIGFIDAFWKAAAKVDPKAAELNEGARFPFCTEAGLEEICKQAGLSGIAISLIEIETEFEDFDAFWMPFTLGAGPAPGYCMSLPADRRAALMDQLKHEIGEAGPVRMPARAWAVRATA